MKFPLSVVCSLLLAGATAGAATASGPVVGVVSDSSGRPVPRAIVQIITADGATAGSVFTDVDGSFRIADAPADCRVRASLAGFQDATADCSTSESLDLTLAVAPISDQVVVSATRTEAPAGQVAASVTAFDRADIERRQQPPLADLLRSAPGVHVVRSGAPGSITSLFVRGGESNYTKVLLDGIPLNEPGGAIDLSNLTTEGLDRVEFVSGANSALFGSDAMTGVIQLFTHRGRTARPEAHARVEFGNFGASRASGGAAGRAGRLDYSADLAHFTTDNEVPNSAFTNTTLSGSAGFQLPHTASFRLVGRMERGRAGVPGQAAFGRPDLDASSEHHDTAWGATFEQTDGRWRQRASYGLSISHQASTNLQLDPPYTPSYQDHVGAFEFFDFAYDSRTRLRRHHATYQSDWTTALSRGGTHIDTALVDWDGERATLTDALNATSLPASRDNVGLSLQHQALWPRAFVSGGLRLEHNASFGSAIVPRASAAYYVRTGTGRIGSTRIGVSAGTGIKEPTILQSFSPSPLFLGNRDLEPERSRTVEVSVEQRLAADRLRLTAAWFDNRYRDIISTRTISFDPYQSQYFNIGLTRARGVELTGDVALVSGLRARAGYTFDDSEILESTNADSDVLKTGNWAFRRPRHDGYLQLSWAARSASIDLTGSFAGRRVDSDFSALEPPLLWNPGYQQWDLRASGRVRGPLWITAAIDNVTGREYMEPLGYPALGRAVRLGVLFRK